MVLPFVHAVAALFLASEKRALKGVTVWHYLRPLPVRHLSLPLSLIGNSLADQLSLTFEPILPDSALVAGSRSKHKDTLMVIALSSSELSNQHCPIFEYDFPPPFRPQSVPLSTVAAIRLRQFEPPLFEVEISIVLNLGRDVEEGIVAVGGEECQIGGVGLRCEGVDLGGGERDEGGAEVRKVGCWSY